MSGKTRKDRPKGGNKKGDNKKNTDKSTNSVPAEPKLKDMKKVEKGGKTFLKCELSAGNPTPKVKWFKDGQEVKQGIKVRKKGKVSELHIKKARDMHAGSYMCEASNDLGKARIFGNSTVSHAATSTTPAAKTSSHVTRCSDSHQNYCVNGGECFTLEVIPGSTKFLCRCKTGYTGKRCEENVPVRVMNPKQHLGIEFMEAEELYQKRVLTITGICIALLVVGIMCVVAYCKTKKQRKKLHDRLRQSLRNDRNSMANGPQNNTPLENVQLVNQHTSKKAMPAHHVMEKDTETSFSTSQCLSSAHQSTTDTHTSSQSWSNGRSDGVLSDSRSILVMSSAEGSLAATPSRRGRLNATGGARDLSSYLKKSRHSTGSCKDTPHSERYISAMTSPNSSPAVDVASPVTPGSPPSEGSAPLSSLATSLAVSPSGEEESPLLFATPLRENVTRNHNQYKRMSAHYNHGHDTDSPPPRIVEHENYESTQEYETATIDMACCPASSPNDLEKNNNNGQRAKRTVANGHVNHKMESNSSSCGSSESETEDERVGEDTPFLCIQIPVAMTLETALRPTDNSRTNPALQLSPQDDLQARMPCVIVNQDPIAV